MLFTRVSPTTQLEQLHFHILFWNGKQTITPTRNHNNDHSANELIKSLFLKPQQVTHCTKSPKYIIQTHTYIYTHNIDGKDNHNNTFPVISPKDWEFAFCFLKIKIGSPSIHNQNSNLPASFTI